MIRRASDRGRLRLEYAKAAGGKVPLLFDLHRPRKQLRTAQDHTISIDDDERSRTA